MNYQQCLDWLFSQLPMYQRQGKAAYKADLKNTIALSNYLKNPERQFKSIHVGGTNGKGSVSHMLASIFQEAGYKVGLYTSPHLIDFRERIKINGELIPEKDVIAFVDQHQSFLQAQQLSFFEMTVGLAFSYFASQEVDMAIIEVGMGGRLDSTNIIHPELAVITNISLDHTAFLGNSISAIAGEKAGIIKANTPVVIGEYNEESFPVFEAKAEVMKAPLHLADQNLTTYKTLVTYQQKNVSTVLKSIEVIQNQYDITEKAIQQGIANVSKNTGLRGRWQILQNNPKTICDTAHNPAGIAMVNNELAKENYHQLHMVFGMVNDKDVVGILKLLPQSATYYFCQANISRALSYELLHEEATKVGLQGKKYATVEKAYQAALDQAQQNDLIFVGGSTFVVADLLLHLSDKKN